MGRLSGVTDPLPGAARLLGPADVRGLAETLGVRPTKTLGQNFVVDPGTVRRIARSAAVGPGDLVLEVGPGLGSLTLALLERGADVLAVEIDGSLAAALPATVRDRLGAGCGSLEVIRADAMAVTAADVLSATGGRAPVALVANLPYNVAVPVLLHLLAELPALDAGLVMVQAEVADRLAAPPGSRTYGIPSAKTAWYAEAARSATIGRTVFWPVPNVDSALVRFRRQDPPETSASREEVFAVVDAAFSQRRKTLRAALAEWAGSPRLAEEALRAADVDPTLRGERLGIADFARIAEHRP